MTISAISGNITTAAMEPRQRRETAPSALHPPPQLRHDTVQLSDTARAKSLQLEGNTPVEIAHIMGADIKSVNGYLKALVQTPVYLTAAAAQAALATLQTAFSLHA